MCLRSLSTLDFNYNLAAAQQHIGSVGLVQRHRFGGVGLNPVDSDKFLNHMPVFQFMVVKSQLSS